MAGEGWLVFMAAVSGCWIHHTLGTSCPIGKFGDTCSYFCHCTTPCNPTTGVCNGACDGGWFGGNGQTCQKEDARCVQAAGYNASQLAVAVVLAFVAGAVVDAIVSAVIWKRRDRCLHKTSESRPTTVSIVPTERPQASDDIGPETRPYDSLNAVSYDAKMKGETYCTVKSGKTNAKTDATVLTSCDVSDSIAAGTYETLDNTSRGTDGEYSEIGKVK